MNQKYSDFGIGEVVKKTGVTHKQLRFWEEKNYLNEIQRVICGDRAYRRYTTDHVKFIQLIKGYLDQGFSLQGAVRKARKDFETGGDDNGAE